VLKVTMSALQNLAKLRFWLFSSCTLRNADYQHSQHSLSSKTANTPTFHCRQQRDNQDRSAMLQALHTTANELAERVIMILF